MFGNRIPSVVLGDFGKKWNRPTEIDFQCEVINRSDADFCLFPKIRFSGLVVRDDAV